MRFYLDYQLHDGDDGAWRDPANMRAFAQACEQAGVGALALTDHPAPSRKWLDAGGHDTLDPFAGLSFFAGCTSTIRLMTYLTVVPYRNPFVLAKAMTSLDLVSGGRATFTLGTGYLRSEFAALNVDMDARNELFDEGMEVVRGLLASPQEFHHDGTHFQALGVTLSPPPVQTPHPPLWLGGNAAVVRERVAAWGDGWAPLTLGGAISGKVSRTAPIPDLAHFAGQIAGIKDRMAELGRDPERLDVASPGIAILKPAALVDEKRAHVAELAEAGVTWTSVPYDKVRFKQALEDVAAFGEDVITPSRN
jgi:probable F420-dependent oxidoreductase